MRLSYADGNFGNFHFWPAPLKTSLGSGSNVFKEAAAWLTEKASSLKLGASSSGDFGTFEALEFLSLGIQGKLSLWAALVEFVGAKQ